MAFVHKLQLMSMSVVIVGFQIMVRWVECSRGLLLLCRKLLWLLGRITLASYHVAETVVTCKRWLIGLFIYITVGRRSKERHIETTAPAHALSSFRDHPPPGAMTVQLDI